VHAVALAVDEALVGDDQVESLDGDGRVVGHRAELAFIIAPGLEGRGFFIRLVQLFPPQHGVEALDGGDDDLGVGIDAVGVQVLDDVGLVELAARARVGVALVPKEGLRPDGLIGPHSTASACRA
jgi:hypothetical protein